MNTNYKNRHTETKLDKYGVSSALQEEIIRMATSSIPRETIIEHIRAQLSVSTADANDIVVASHILAKKSQPKRMHTVSAQRLQMAQKLKKYEKDKEDLTAAKLG